MANSGPNTNGSQFFIVYRDTQLDPNYTIFGTVTKGLEVAEKVAKAGAQTGAGRQAEAPDHPHHGHAGPVVADRPTTRAARVERAAGQAGGAWTALRSTTCSAATRRSATAA